MQTTTTLAAAEAAETFPFLIGTLNVHHDQLIEYFVSIGWMAPLDQDHPRRRHIGINTEFKQCRDLMNMAARQLEPEKRFHIFYNRGDELYEILAMPEAIKKDPGVRRVNGLSRFRLKELQKNIKATDARHLIGESMGKHINATKKVHQLVQQVTGTLTELSDIIIGKKPEQLPTEPPPKKVAARETRGRSRQGPKHKRSRSHAPGA